jgi:hypothetical protein
MNSLRDPMAALRSLDPAPEVIDPRGHRARADLARILATDPAPAGDRGPSRRPKVVRIAVAATAAVALSAGLVMLPSLTRSDQAYATWTAQPTALGKAEQPGAADACRDSLRGGAGESYGAELAAATAAVAERRGVWTLVLLAGGDGFSAVCITDESRPLFQSSIGYIGTRPEGTRPGGRDVTPDALGVGMVNSRELSVAAGAVGSNVTAIMYESAKFGRVQATVSNGHFAFWLPGDELDNESKDGTPVQVTYRDGSTATLTLTLQ